MEWRSVVPHEEMMVKKMTWGHLKQGEKARFGALWVLFYVAQGRLTVVCGGKQKHLEQRELLLCPPSQGGQTVLGDGELFFVAFDCKASMLRPLAHCTVLASHQQRKMLFQLIEEGKALVSGGEKPFASEQMMKLSLEFLLISLCRGRQAVEGEQTHLVEEVIAFLEGKVGQNVTFGEVAAFAGISKTRLKTLFKQVTDMSVMQYYTDLKMRHAKRLIREGKGTFTHIAGLLGYDSVHYFSRQFKALTGMTPSQYAKQNGA